MKRIMVLFRTASTAEMGHRRSQNGESNPACCCPFSFFSSGSLLSLVLVTLESKKSESEENLLWIFVGFFDVRCGEALLMSDSVLARIICCRLLATTSEEIAGFFDVRSGEALLIPDSVLARIICCRLLATTSEEIAGLLSMLRTRTRPGVIGCFPPMQRFQMANSKSRLDKLFGFESLPCRPAPRE